MRPAEEAREILTVAYRALFQESPSWPALRLLLAQSRQEGMWGAFGGVDALGDPYGENWGAVQAKMGPPCPPGTFEAGDSRPTAEGQKPFRWCFLGYPPTDEMGPLRGARDFLRHALVYRPSAHAAARTGDPERYARALYGDGKRPYFGGFGRTKEERIQSYVTMLRAQLKEVDRAFGLSPPPLDAAAAPSAARRSPALPLLLLAGIAGFYFVKR